jgi:hypothetical protein
MLTIATLANSNAESPGLGQRVSSGVTCCVRLHKAKTAKLTHSRKEVGDPYTEPKMRREQSGLIRTAVRSHVILSPFVLTGSDLLCGNHIRASQQQPDHWSSSANIEVTSRKFGSPGVWYGEELLGYV